LYIQIISFENRPTAAFVRSAQLFYIGVTLWFVLCDARFWIQTMALN